jgi:hypothetical protein
VVQLDMKRLRTSRAEVFAALRAEGIGVNVHYIPVHLHPYYREHQGTAVALCPRGGSLRTNPQPADVLPHERPGRAGRHRSGPQGRR